jgi:hypothetical protein
MDIWTRHINGAVTLIKLRGKEQMLDPISRRLFCAVRTLMVWRPSIVFEEHR